MQFRYSPDYADIWLTLNPQEREIIDLMKAYVQLHPFQGKYYNTDLSGREWFAHEGVGFILIYRVEGRLILLADIVRWDGPDYD